MPIVEKLLHNTIAFDLTCLQTLKANIISANSLFLGLNFVTQFNFFLSKTVLSLSCRLLGLRFGWQSSFLVLVSCLRCCGSSLFWWVMPGGLFRLWCVQFCWCAILGVLCGFWRGCVFYRCFVDLSLSVLRYSVHIVALLLLVSSCRCFAVLVLLVVVLCSRWFLFGFFGKAKPVQAHSGANGRDEIRRRSLKRSNKFNRHNIIKK